MTRFEHSYREIAIKVRIPGYDDPKVDILDPILRWLSEKQNGPWLMILDNADDAAVFFDRPGNKSGNAISTDSSRPFISFIPSVPHGMVLVTSRDRTVADNLVGDFSTPIRVNVFDDLQSLEVLKTKVPVDASEEQEALELVETLDRIPLAITQAGAYIRQRAPRMTIQKYLSVFRKNNANQTTLLNSGARDLRRDSEVPDSVISTWEISFIQIREQYLPAANLLSLMSLFNRQSIPDVLIKPETHDDDGKFDHDADSPEPEIEFDNAIALLIAFSLVRTETNKDFFEMHRLVQVATRRWLESNGSIQQWKSNAIARMADTMPDGEYENWKTCVILLPHANEIITYQAANIESKLQRASVLENVAWYQSEIGNFSVAVRMSEEALCVRRQFLHEDDHAVLDNMTNLALIYKNLGRWKEAEDLEVQVMETNLRVLGEEHQDTLISMNNLAVTFWTQGRLKEAEELSTKVVKTRKRVLGTDHPHTLNSMGNLAIVFRRQGRWQEAKDLSIQVIETEKRVLGAEHPSTLIDMSNLATIFYDQGQLKEAENLVVQIIEIRKRVLGAKHPDTLTAMANLAFTYKAQDQNERAIELMTRVTELRSKVLGAEHPRTIAAIKYLESCTAIRE
jgi:tetratricopeptide (TPR) repeat protein